MRFRRAKEKPRTRRQRLLEDQPAKPAANFSYGSRRSDQGRQPGRQASAETQPSASHWSRFWLRRIGLLALLIAILVSAANILSLSANSKVMPLEGDAGQTFLRPVEVYEAAANQKLDDSIWNRNKVTVDTAAISRHLEERFPDLSKVSVNVPLLSHRPLIYVEPVKPALVLVTSSGAFVIDTDGKALVEGDSAAGLNQPDLPVLNDQSGLAIKANDQALPADDVSFIRTVIAQLAAKQYAVSSMSLPAASSQLDVQVAGQPYFVKFNLQSDDPRGQAGTFLATISKLKSQNITPSKYVDVRVDGRAYYQ